MPKKILLTCAISAAMCTGFAQEPNMLQLKNGAIELNSSKEINVSSYPIVIQFYSIPNEKDLFELASAKVELKSYLGNSAYLAIVGSEISQNNYLYTRIKASGSFPGWAKLDPYLYTKEVPTYAVNGNRIGVKVKSTDFSLLKKQLNALNAQEITTTEDGYVICFLKETKIEELANFQFVISLEVIPDPGTPESEDGRNLHRSGAIDRQYTGSYDFDGSGVGIGINDDGYVGPHIDYTGRINNQEVASDFNGNHGDMCAGIAGAVGNLDPDMSGMAPGSYLYIRQYNSGMNGTVSLHQDSGIMVFNSSYSNGCNAGYTSTTNKVDSEIYNNRALMQVFSAGNSNNNDCGYGAGDQWGNITGGHKIGKNVIAVANLDNQDLLRSSSSRGPAEDGRIKPDLAAHGHEQMATDPYNQYAPGGGTSAAAPGVAGVVAQLYEAYRSFNNGLDPESGLIKAALLNTANDLGNKGPDFKFGWGKVNALRALQLLEENRYFIDTLSQGDSVSYTMNIPSGIKEAKIMVYWVDREASTSASVHLVNDFDAQLIDVNGNITYPYILDESPNAVTLDLPATTGEDHLNNVEQLFLQNPAAGNYTLKVKANALPFGSDEFIVVYEYRTDEVTLTYPLGGESWLTNFPTRVHWDAIDNGQDFQIELSINNGNTWTQIASVPHDERFYNFSMGSAITGEARVRVIRGSEVSESEQNFTIMPGLSNLKINRVCSSSSSIELIWHAMSSATEYTVYMLGNKYMDSVMTVTSNTAQVTVPNLNDSYWFAVQPKGTNGKKGKRSIAINYDGGSSNSNCNLDCDSDEDVGVNLVVSPSSNYDGCVGDSIEVRVQLENIGLVSQTGFDVHYQFDNLPVVTETYTGNLNSGTSVLYTFMTKQGPLTNGSHNFKAWTDLAVDLTVCNDSISKVVEVQDMLNVFPIVEDFENMNDLIGFINNPDEDVTFEQTVATISTPGMYSLYINHFIYNAEGEVDEFETRTIDFPSNQASTALLQFDVAYRQYQDSFDDELHVLISTDCGTSFDSIYSKVGPALSTQDGYTNNFQPNPASWRTDSIDLSTYVNDKVILKWVTVNDYGNNLFIDNINIGTDVNTNVEELTVKEYSISPNPMNDVVFIHGLEGDLADYKLFSINGQLIDQGNYTGQILVDYLSKGLYILEIEVNGHTHSFKVSKL